MADDKKALERVYNIPLRKSYQKAPHYLRAKKSINALRKFVNRHMRSDNIKISKSVNERIWGNGIKNPPHHIKITCVKDEQGIVRVELFGVKKETEKSKSGIQKESKKEDDSDKKEK